MSRRTRSRRTRPRRATGQGIAGPSRGGKAEHDWSKRDVDSLRQIHELRSATAQATDNALDAPLAPTPGHWIRYPNRFDVHGVDYPELRTPKAKRDLEPHQRMEPVEPAKKPKPSKKNPLTTPVDAKKHLAPLVEKYAKKLGIEGEIRLSATNRGWPAKIRHYADGKSPQIEINYDHFSDIYTKDPELTGRYLEYAIAHELSHAQQAQELGWKGYVKASKVANIELELDAEKRTYKALGRSEEDLAKDLKKLAEKTGGTYSNKYNMYKIREGSDLSRFKDTAPTQKDTSAKAKMKDLYMKALGEVIPSATAAELTLIADKAIAENWIKPSDKNSVAVFERVADKARAELTQMRKSKAEAEREAQLQALKERSDAIKQRNQVDEDIENAIMDQVEQNGSINREALKTAVADYLGITGVDRDPFKTKVATMYDKMKQDGKLKDPPLHYGTQNSQETVMSKQYAIYDKYLREAVDQGDLDRIMANLNIDPDISQSDKYKVAGNVEQLRDILPIGRGVPDVAEMNARAKAYDESVRGRVAKMPFNEANGLIRDHIKAVCPTVSIRKGQGTARSWLDIEGSGEYGRFTDQEKKQLETLGIAAYSNSHAMDFDDKVRFIERHKLLEAKPMKKAEPVFEIPDKKPVKEVKPVNVTDADKRTEVIIKQIQAAKPHLTEAAIRELIKQERVESAFLLSEEVAAHLVAANMKVSLKERQHLPTKGVAKLNEAVLDGSYRVDVWNPQKVKWVTEKKFDTKDQADAYIRLVNDNPGWSKSFKERIGAKDVDPKYLIDVENTKARGSEAAKYEIYTRLPVNDRRGDKWIKGVNGKDRYYKLHSKGTHEYKTVPDKDQLIKDLTQDIGANNVEVNFKLNPHWAPAMSQIERIGPSADPRFAPGKYQVLWQNRREKGYNKDEGHGAKYFETFEDALDFVNDRAEGEATASGKYEQRGILREARWVPPPNRPDLPEELKGFTGKQDRFEVDPEPRYESKWNTVLKEAELKWVFYNKKDTKNYTLDELKAEHQKGEWRRRDRVEAAKNNSSISREKGAKTKPFYRVAKPIVAAITHPEEASMVVEGSRVTYHGMDPSHVSMIKITVPNELDIPDGNYQKAEHSLDNRATVYSSPKKVEWDNVERQMVIENGDQRSSVRYEKVHEINNNLPSPRIQYTAKAEIDLENFSKDMKDLTKLSEGAHVILIATDGKLTYETPEDSNGITRATGDAGKILNITQDKVQATYTLAYIENQLDLLNAAGFTEATLELADDMPLKLTAKRGDGPYTVEAWLAPCIGV